MGRSRKPLNRTTIPGVRIPPPPHDNYFNKESYFIILYVIAKRYIDLELFRNPLLLLMKKISFFSAFLLIFLVHSMASAQLRENQSKSTDYMGNVVVDRDREAGNLSNLFNMTMDHSYSMMFGSVGGQYQNINAYTNTMHFFFSEKMTGRVDLAVLHSPFGNSYLNSGNSNQQVDFIIRNAEINYQLSDRSNITFQFQQIPSYGYGYNRYSPFYNQRYYERNY